MYLHLCRSNHKTKIIIIGSSNNIMTKERRALRSGKTGLQCSAQTKSRPNKKKRKKITGYDKYEKALEEAVVAKRVSRQKKTKNDECGNMRKQAKQQQQQQQPLCFFNCIKGTTTKMFHTYGITESVGEYREGV